VSRKPRLVRSVRKLTHSAASTSNDSLNNRPVPDLRPLSYELRSRPRPRSLGPGAPGEGAAVHAPRSRHPEVTAVDFKDCESLFPLLPELCWQNVLPARGSPIPSSERVHDPDPPGHALSPLSCRRAAKDFPVSLLRSSVQKEFLNQRQCPTLPKRTSYMHTPAGFWRQTVPPSN